MIFQNLWQVFAGESVANTVLIRKRTPVNETIDRREEESKNKCVDTRIQNRVLSKARPPKSPVEDSSETSCKDNYCALGPLSHQVHF